MKRALIFGIGGFVGPYLARELIEHGYEVFGADAREPEDGFAFSGYFRCDILDRDSVRKTVDGVKPDCIVNLAAISSVGQSWKMPDATMQVNVNGTLNIFEGCLSAGVRPAILLIGSSEEYVPSKEPMDENTPINANNPYGISKVAQEQFARIYRDKYGWKIFCVRSFNHIGVGQRPSFVIPSWCKQAADIEKGLAEPVLKVGNLNVARDFTDVRDVVRAYRLVLESKDASQVYNIGSGKALPLSAILGQIVSFSSKKIQVQIDESLLRTNDNECICCDHGKITSMLGWELKIGIEESLKEIYESFLL